MDAKQMVSEKLLKLSKELIGELRNINYSADDEDYDAGLKERKRDALTKLNDMVVDRVREIIADIDKKKTRLPTCQKINLHYKPIISYSYNRLQRRY